LIVIVIMGILAGIVVFAVSNLTSDADKNSCGTEKSTVDTAVEAFKAKLNRYPKSMTELTAGATEGTKSVEALLKSQPSKYKAASPGTNEFTITFDTTNGATITVGTCQ
jgi:general secretion pathway protein G